ncbi:regulator of vps4 activity in the mvb pathway protein [Cystoisospora suis]|uniref:Regulator of vps4 activity in the mvb pathway protein n=1 Tax=Cystoisospora suis TaxID=483139 RepID=A0A2C6LBY4_9APIC|nr:regulator of vps4 activity in the mvb pathway protein [Cystoisospora suis]
MRRLLSFSQSRRPTQGFAWPFEKFDSAVCKASLKMAMSRARMNQNKLQNSIRVQRAEIAVLLSEGKEERARLKAEHLLRESRMERAMDILQTLCELIVTRMNYLSSEKFCPSDLLSPVHSVLYCEPRLNIDELKVVRKQLAMKYGQHFVEEAVKNGKQEAHFKPVELEILEVLTSVAKEYGVSRWLANAEENTERSPHSPGFIPKPPSACGSVPLQSSSPPGPETGELPRSPDKKPPSLLSSHPRWLFSRYRVEKGSSPQQKHSNTTSPADAGYPTRGSAAAKAVLLDRDAGISTSPFSLKPEPTKQGEREILKAEFPRGFGLTAGEAVGFPSLAPPPPLPSRIGMTGCPSVLAGNSPAAASPETERVQPRPPDEDRGYVSTTPGSSKSGGSRSSKTNLGHEMTFRKAVLLAAASDPQGCGIFHDENPIERKESNMPATQVENHKRHTDTPGAVPAVVSSTTGKTGKSLESRSPVQRYFTRDSPQTSPCYNGFPMAAKTAFGSPTGTLPRKGVWTPF